MVQTVNCVEVRWISQRYGETVLVPEYRHNPVFFGDVAWNQRNYVIGDLHFAEIHHFRAEVRRFCLRDISGSHQLVRQHQIYQPYSCRLRFLLKRRHLVRRHKPEVNQDIYQIIVFFCHGSVFHYTRSSWNV